VSAGFAPAPLARLALSPAIKRLMGANIYLAGPAVFRPNAAEIGERLSVICRTYGLRGVFPWSPEELTADKISEFNEGLIRDCRGMVADLTPFRGPHMDPGTAYEIGVARTLGKPVWFYSADRRLLADRVPVARHINGRIYDASGDAIEDFGLAENLMITRPQDEVYSSADAAIRAAAIALGSWQEKEA
jgi:nucleoside 2-deoxyribosyltransferase